MATKKKLDRTPAGPPSFEIFGHRGAPRTAPENTIRSLEEAVTSGCGFETDLRRLGDGSIVLYHDASIRGRAVGGMSYRELAEQVPGLVELAELRRFLGRCRMVLEVKERGFEQELFEITGEWRGVIISSFQPAVIEKLQALGCSHPLGLVGDRRIDEAVKRAIQLGVETFFPHYHHIHPDLVRTLHAEGIAVYAWSPNRLSVWTRVLESGCDGMITDLPALAAQWRTERTLGNVLNSAP